MQSFLRNLRHGVQRLAHARTFTVVSILTLALGVGANTAIFSLIQAVLLHPAGINDPETLASFHTQYTQLNLPSIGVSVPDFADAQSLKSVVSSAALSDQGSFNATLGDRTLHLNSALVTWQWFQVFGAEPILGRTFLPEEDQKGAAHVVVLSYSSWQRLLGGDRDAVGKTVILDEQPYRVVGVMRSDFDWPRSSDLWTPLALAPGAHATSERFNEFFDSVVRLKPGVSVEQLNAALAQKNAEEVRREGADSYALRAGWSMFAQPWTRDAAGDLRKPLIALFAVAFAVLLIACANISGLMLARANQRTRELAIRTALGASVSEIAAQLASEVFLIAGVATLIGILSGPIVGRLLLLSIPHDLAAGFSVHPSASLLLGAAGLGLFAALLSGFAPVLRVIRHRASLRLAEYGRSSTSSASKQRFRAVLVFSQVALAFTLLAGTGLFLSSLRELQRVDPGFRANGVLTGYVTLSGPSYRTNSDKKSVFVQDVISRIARQPGVTAAAAVFPLPFGSTVSPSGSFEIESRPTNAGDPGPHCDKRWTTAGYLAVMKVPLFRGRWFSDDDRSNTQPVAVIDDVLARAYWPNQDPIGQRIRSDDRSWVQIIGVVGHVRRDSLEVDENKGVIYRPFVQDPVNETAFILRTTAANPEPMKTALSFAVRSADPSEAIYDVRSLGSLVNQSLAGRHLLVSLLSAFGGLALVLAAIGIYGLLSSTASERTTKIGIRMALGAQRSQVVFFILRDTLALIGVGLLAGFALAAMAQRVLAHQFAAMGAGILPSLFVAMLSLLIAAFLAAIIPAFRSASVDPVITLQSE
jgi:predicted permease